jgi:hypothetical protein
MNEELVKQCVEACVAWRVEQKGVSVVNAHDRWLELLMDEMCKRDPIYQEMFVG